MGVSTSRNPFSESTARTSARARERMRSRSREVGSVRNWTTRWRVRVRASSTAPRAGSGRNDLAAITQSVTSTETSPRAVRTSSPSRATTSPMSLRCHSSRWCAGRTEASRTAWTFLPRRSMSTKTTPPWSRSARMRPPVRTWRPERSPGARRDPAPTRAEGSSPSPTPGGQGSIPAFRRRSALERRTFSCSESRSAGAPSSTARSSTARTRARCSGVTFHLWEVRAPSWGRKPSRTPEATMTAVASA